MSQPISICWFRQDLRLGDNPALFHAATQGAVLPVYILDDDNALESDSNDKLQMGAAARCWLHQSLHGLNEDLNGKLRCYRGKAEDILIQLCQQHDIKQVYWNRVYQPWQIARDKQIKTRLHSTGIEAQSFDASLLWEPWQVLKADGTPYRVFTPYYQKGCLNSPPPPLPIPAPKLTLFDYTKQMKITKSSKGIKTLPIEALELKPSHPWTESVLAHWDYGEAAAWKMLKRFCETGLEEYQKGRDFPAIQSVSRLSPYLQLGAISPRQIWHQIRKIQDDQNSEHYCRELAWREFCYYQLYHFPYLPEKNLQSKFDRFPWQNNSRWLTSWQRGQTGIPLVDAGMRELWQTGFMHNRVRMVVASFLTKNLLIDWRLGAEWFWDCLLDADLASNSANWQWVAGCGLDAAPYFRIFNPATQAQKFDPDGEYIRQFVPEIRSLPDRYLSAPWQAPESILKDAGITLGQTYPHPIVDLKESREVALRAYQAIK